MKTRNVLAAAAACLTLAGSAFADAIPVNVFVMHWPDGSADASVASASGTWFGAGSVSTVVQQLSYGNKWLTGTIYAAYSSLPKDPSTMCTTAGPGVLSIASTVPSKPAYARLQAYLISCSGISGRAQIGGGWVVSGPGAGESTHEFLHAMGLAHVGTASCAADFSSCSYNAGYIGHSGIGFTAPHRHKVGWLLDARIVDVPAGGGGVYHVAPLNLPSTGTQAVRIGPWTDPTYSYSSPIWIQFVSDSNGPRLLLDVENGIGCPGTYCSDVQDLGIAGHNLAAGDRVDDPHDDIHIKVVSIGASEAVVKAWHGAVEPGGDNAPPTVALTAPGAGATVSGTVAVSASASDNVDVAGVQFKLDGANLGAEATAPPYSTSWNTASAAPGAHALTAVARDAAGNTTTSAAVNVTVAAALTTGAKLFSPAGPALTGGAVKVLVEVDDPAVTNVELDVDGQAVGAAKP